ncbi:mitochondrial fission ELM1 family protein [Alsobacter sp. SYSU BS001988]
MLPPATTCWIITDGKAGDEGQCLGVAEGLGLAPEIRRVAPRAPWSWLAPWGPVDPREAPGRAGGPLAGPPPDIAIASGRRAVPALKALKRASGGRTFTVFLKDPRTGTGAADFIWVPEHDRLRGPNVLATLTSPHRVTPERLAAARAAPPAALAALPRPRVALLLGGDSRHHVFTGEDILRLTGQIGALAQTGAGLMATASRRSPPALVEGVRSILRGKGGYFWDGTGDNPYIAMLALADAIVVTADSANMVGEACATGRPVLVFEPSWRCKKGSDRLRRQIIALNEAGAVRFFQGRLESHAYPALDSTPVIASAIEAAYLRRRSTPA